MTYFHTGWKFLDALLTEILINILYIPPVKITVVILHLTKHSFQIFALLSFSLPGGIIECPIKLFFTIDTSETIALQESPPGILVDKVKEFTKMFAQRLANEDYKDQVHFSWSIGGLNFSQTQWVFSKFTTRENFIRNVGEIRYKGKGTFTDCALKNMIYQMTQHYSEPKAVLFAVVITDGHVTGSPCGGMKAMSYKAQEQGINIFSVAASRSIDKVGMEEIASSPVGLYRDDLIAVDIIDGLPKIETKSIDRIIKAMVIRIFLS